MRQTSITAADFPPQITCGLASTLNPAYRVFSSWPWEKEYTP